MNKKTVDTGFPFHESYLDYAGNELNFVITVRKTLTNGFIVNAVEENKPYGYEFQTYTPSDPYAALGEIRDKIRKGLSTCYVRKGKHDWELTHDSLRAKISHLGIIVNGQLIQYEQLSEMLKTYEGFNISIEISGPEA
ncbi:MAG: hypothetical protein GY770_02045 [Aestuariibacter sp.]|nr:hypothetical protein [Aestuariibacter sp.]MCP5010045.1 hypothetical protein [Aestuariibacter sp.]